LARTAAIGNFIRVRDRNRFAIGPQVPNNRLSRFALGLRALLTTCTFSLVMDNAGSSLLFRLLFRKRQKGKFAMGLKSTSDRYGAVAIAIHWLSAVLIIGMFVLGIVASETTDAALKATILRIHAPLGLAILALTLLRIVWWLVADRKPSPVAGQPLWQSLLSQWVHRLLYISVLVMIGSGIWLMMSSGAAEVIFDGAAKPLPDFAIFPAYLVHSTMAMILEALFILHVLAALYHQFIRKDRLFARMGIGRAITK
jgi:cytochrome b561